MAFTLLLIAGLQVLNAEATRPCVSPLYAEYGQIAATFACSLPSSYYGIYWYKSPARNERSVVSIIDGVVMSGDDKFGISPSGSLIVRNITFEDEHLYRLIILRTRQQSETHDLRLTVYVLPPAHQVPTILECEEKMDCILTRPNSGVLSCYVEGVRPVLLLEWEQVNSTKPSITFSHHQYTTDNRGEVFDVRLTASYELTGGPDAGPIIVACVIKGPVMTGQQTTATIVNNSPVHAELSGDMSCNNTTPSTSIAWAIATVTSATSLILSLVLVGLLIAVRNGGMFRKQDGRPTPI